MQKLTIGLIGFTLILLLSCEKDKDKIEDNANNDLEGTFTDTRDGQIYKWVKIGNQIWMAENLKAKQYTSGTMLDIGAEAENIFGDFTSKYWFAYGASEENLNVYGALYTWAAVMNGAASSNANPSVVQGVCPTGWHIPSDSEWQELELYLGMGQDQVNQENWRGLDEGGKLKQTGTDYWSSPNTGATNESGFTALPGGTIGDLGAVPFNLGSRAYFWTSTQHDSAEAWIRILDSNSPLINRWSSRKSHAHSVRCVKD